MKKLVAIIICILVAFSMPFSTHAAENDVDVSNEETPADDFVAETEDENSGAVESPSEPIKEDEALDVAFDEEEKSKNEAVTEKIAKFFEKYGIEIGQIVTIIAGVITVLKKCKDLIKSASTMNDNTITISEKNADIMSRAQSSVQAVTNAIVKYEDQIGTIIEAYRQSEEEKRLLKDELLQINENFKIFTEANLEFSNELAELLGLANIPNYKKEEMGARHLAAAKSIIESTQKIDAVVSTLSEEKKNNEENRESEILDT